MKIPHNLHGEDSYFRRLRQAASELSAAEIFVVARKINDLLTSDSQLIIAGNGGSAATASHWAADLLPATKSERGSLRTLILGEMQTRLSALSNDYSFEDAYARLLAAYGRPGDLLITLSVSGNSENLVRCAKTAKTRGIQTVALLGNNGGRLQAIVDLSIRIGSNDYSVVEDVHLSICHRIAEHLRGRSNQIQVRSTRND